MQSIEVIPKKKRHIKGGATHESKSEKIKIKQIIDFTSSVKAMFIMIGRSCSARVIKISEWEGHPKSDTHKDTQNQTI